ncbi:MAG: D-glycero-D-manno-heptose 1,7-bisphosphate phosphatase [Chloroflexota bacterium]|jgi:histidinol-phosphate phosphatase family protein|nr:D-glycero-D-manno-heptose 1,7-bisphosphate phosphatase [Chloroflexota bacterium]
MTELERPAQRYLRTQADLLERIDPGSIENLAAILETAWAGDHAVLVCGNGGSASIATHIACDLSKQTLVAGRPALRVISLADNMAIVSAWANDAGFSRVFAEQVAVHGRSGDVLLCLSCSGHSENVLEAIRMAREQGMTVVAMVGFDGGAAAAAADLAVHVPSDDYGAVESMFLVVEHCVARLLADSAAAVSPSNTRRAVFVDRDGVINRNLPGGVVSWDEFEFLPGALDGLARLTQAGYRIVVVSNQANVGRGLITRAQLDDLHRRMRQEVMRAGGAIAALYYCEHLPEDGCDCRKPAPGLLLRAAADLDIDLAATYFVGDHDSDVQAAVAAGARPLVVRSGRGHGSASAPVVDDLSAAALLILDGAPREGALADVSSATQ